MIRRIHYRNRKRLRLPNYNYSKAGAYFLTICIYEHECVFGYIENGKVILSDLGKLAHDCWVQIPQHFAGVELDEFIIMPNHVHGIIIIRNLTGNELGNENTTFGNANVKNINVRNANVGNAYIRSLHLRTNKKTNDRTKMMIPKIIQQYKAAVTRIHNQSPDEPPFQWQRSYYDHIIRNPYSFNRIRRYIRTNPIQWQKDIKNLRNRILHHA